LVPPSALSVGSVGSVAPAAPAAPVAPIALPPALPFQPQQIANPAHLAAAHPVIPPFPEQQPLFPVSLYQYLYIICPEMFLDYTTAFATTTTSCKPASCCTPPFQSCLADSSSWRTKHPMSFLPCSSLES
jgi:hypothetical protein